MISKEEQNSMFAKSLTSFTVFLFAMRVTAQVGLIPRALPVRRVTVL